MATVRLIVNGALRKLGRLGGGREPRTADQADTLAALQGLYTSWIAAGAFGRLRDVVPIGAIYATTGDERIFRQSEDTMTVQLPELIGDEWFCDYGREGFYGTVVVMDGPTFDIQRLQPLGWVKPPRDGSAVVITDQISGNTASWLYDGTMKQWQRLDTLQLDEEAPRSAADPEGLSATLALEVADIFGAEVLTATQRQAARYQAALTQRLGMRREAVAGVYF